MSAERDVVAAGGGSLDRDPVPIVTGTRPGPDHLHAPSSKAPQVRGPKARSPLSLVRRDLRHRGVASGPPSSPAE
jgi:hypothetical protein